MGRLMTLRIIWAALLMGELMFLGIVLTVGRGNPDLNPDSHRIFLYVAVVMLATLVPLAFVVRSLIYRKGRREDGTVDAGAYATGNIIFWAMCEGVAFMGLTSAFLNQGGGPTLWVAALAMAVQAASFPTGGPLREDEK